MIYIATRIFILHKIQSAVALQKEPFGVILSGESAMNVFLFDYYANTLKKCVPEEFSELVSVDPPRDASFGDFSTNIAMVLAKKIGKSPIEIANDIVSQLKDNSDFEDLNVKKPAFINWRIPKAVLLKFIPTILNNDFGRIDMGKGRPINIEYVSANPTGPMHAGHVRGAVSGDVLAALLAFVGYRVTKEYYINDAGKQVDVLARSLHHRYLELFDSHTPTLEDGYPGEYLIETAKKLKEQYGNRFVSLEKEEDWLSFFRDFAINDMLDTIKQDLDLLGVHHDVFSSERELVKSGKVDDAIKILTDKGLIYRGVLPRPKSADAEDWEPHEQLLFRSTKFGDDVDRPLQKSDGSWTYFASDVAYHQNKLERGFEELIDIWGADHGGYVKRMQSAVEALSDETRTLQVKLIQLVRLMENGKEVRMSKRAGTFVTAKDIVSRVGKDVVRFIMLTRKDDASLDFDFQKVVDESRENPVFYVQYASARAHSVLRQFNSTFQKEIPEQVDLSLLDSEGELKLLKTLLDWPRQVYMAARSREPHRIVFYLLDVATDFHTLWNSGKENSLLRFVLADDFNKTCARMIMIKAMLNVIKIALNIIGIEPIEEMR